MGKIRKGQLQSYITYVGEMTQVSSGSTTSNVMTPISTLNFTTSVAGDLLLNGFVFLQTLDTNGNDDILLQLDLDTGAQTIGQGRLRPTALYQGGNMGIGCKFTNVPAGNHSIRLMAMSNNSKQFQWIAGGCHIQVLQLVNV